MEDPCKPGNPRDVSKEEFIELFNVNKERDENAYLLTEPQMTLAEITRKARIKAVEFESEGQKLLS